jgi:hypothetical protein
MDSSANIIDAKFYRSVIRSVASLTYDQAQAMLDTPESELPTDETSLPARIIQSVKSLNHLARQLKQQRINEGALTLASPEVRFKFDDAESRNPTDVTEYAIKESHSLVEEFMLLANITGPPSLFLSVPLFLTLSFLVSLQEDAQTLPNACNPSSPSASIPRAVSSFGFCCQCCWSPFGYQVFPPRQLPSPPLCSFLALTAPPKPWLCHLIEL